MRLSKYLIPTLKEVPSDAQIISHQLMLRAGLIRKSSSGLYSYLPLGVRILNKVIQIVREEMDRSGALEVITPILVPRDFLEISGRYEIFGENMLRTIDRHQNEYALGPTHEEGVTNLFKHELQSYKDLPINLYQIHYKFRDEIRPRYGVIRTREFVMKDAYSFHIDEQSLDETYNMMSSTYRKIFNRCGLDTVPVKADSGAMGGSGSEEFMVRSEVGEETIIECSQCGYVANVEKAVCYDNFRNKDIPEQDRELIDTPNVKTIEEVSKFLNKSHMDFIKTLVYQYGENFVMVLIRGDLDVNEVKLNNALGGVEVVLPEQEEIIQKLSLPIGFLGPVDLIKEIEIIADNSIKDIVNGVSGANIKDKHYINININKDFIVSRFADLRIVKEGDQCIECKSPIRSFKGVEVGHIFKLGDKYTKAFNVNYLDEQGNSQIPIMGTYGIGVTRILAAVIEHSHDKDGIIWPLSIAPYQVIIIPINWKDDQQRTVAKELYKNLNDRNIEVLLDDRDLRPGVKFKDADLIGIPIRINIGDKSLAQQSVELKLRKESGFNLVPVKDVVDRILGAISEHLIKLQS